MADCHFICQIYLINLFTWIIPLGPPMTTFCNPFTTFFFLIYIFPRQWVISNKYNKIIEKYENQQQKRLQSNFNGGIFSFVAEKLKEYLFLDSFHRFPCNFQLISFGSGCHVKSDISVNLLLCLSCMFFAEMVIKALEWLLCSQWRGNYHYYWNNSIAESVKRITT